jgi:hypothetical protein
LSREQAIDLRRKLAPELFELLFVEAMPIQDAVNLARFLVEATISFVKFSVARPKTVGGPIGIAAITKHGAFAGFSDPESWLGTFERLPPAIGKSGPIAAELQRLSHRRITLHQLLHPSF